jgi:hypothetical protein
MAVPALVDQVSLSRYKSAASGNSYIALNALVAGTALPIYSNTAQLMVLWNKSVAKNLAIQSVQLNLVSGTAMVVGGFGFTPIMAGTGLGTPISANVPVASIYKMSTFEAASSADFSWCTATVAAPTIFIPTGFTCMDALTLASTTIGMYSFFREYDGSLIIPPGVAFAFCGNVAQDEVFNVAIQFEVKDK